ncbi:putative transcriptional regulator [Prosthecobacter fusiformis]|uniref:Putative transcriptional regulator n=1 Tax=Prosthecobacter fusiformis TaxID=48464 RepID=A0A4R7RR68_9BACT|nr:BlaI/MecI/CopY family transcriptional regulator [Prosthecobacter fusiformis]TDU68052.1 putative transcriptional regulator [Prosthecobacter fusiformis]
MSDPNNLSRRERQIMDVLHAAGSATVARVQVELPDPPTDMAVRRMMHILEEKGHAKRLGKEGREVVYAPAQSKARAGLKALRHVLDTFFGGAMDEALAAHLTGKNAALTDEQAMRLQQLIEEARKEGR